MNTRPDTMCENYLDIIQIVPNDVDYDGIRNYDDLYEFLDIFLVI